MGYYFDGWAAESLSGYRYSEGYPYTFAPSYYSNETSITFYATWRGVVDYTIIQTSSSTCDIEFNLPTGWTALCSTNGIWTSGSGGTSSSLSGSSFGSSWSSSGSWWSTSTTRFGSFTTGRTYYFKVIDSYGKNYYLSIHLITGSSGNVNWSSSQSASSSSSGSGIYVTFSGSYMKSSSSSSSGSSSSLSAPTDLTYTVGTANSSGNNMLYLNGASGWNISYSIDGANYSNYISGRATCRIGYRIYIKCRRSGYPTYYGSFVPTGANTSGFIRLSTSLSSSSSASSSGS